MDYDIEITVTSGKPLGLEESYELAIKSIDIDVNNDKHHRSLQKRRYPSDGWVNIMTADQDLINDANHRRYYIYTD